MSRSIDKIEQLFSFDRTQGASQRLGAGAKGVSGGTGVASRGLKLKPKEQSVQSSAEPYLNRMSDLISDTKELLFQAVAGQDRGFQKEGLGGLLAFSQDQLFKRSISRTSCRSSKCFNMGHPLSPLSFDFASGIIPASFSFFINSTSVLYLPSL